MEPDLTQDIDTAIDALVAIDVAALQPLPDSTARFLDVVVAPNVRRSYASEASALCHVTAGIVAARLVKGGAMRQELVSVVREGIKRASRYHLVNAPPGWQEAYGTFLRAVAEVELASMIREGVVKDDTHWLTLTPIEMLVINIPITKTIEDTRAEVTLAAEQFNAMEAALPSIRPRGVSPQELN